MLRYQKRRQILWTIALLPQLLFSYILLFALVAPSTRELIEMKLGGLFILLYFGPFLVDMLLFREIRLYRDRIDKEWRLIGSRELDLERVGLIKLCMPTWGVGGKWFFDQRTSRYWRSFIVIFHSMGITYLENLADRKKARQLDLLLAELSGRSVQEFEKGGTMEVLMKEGKS